VEDIDLTLRRMFSGRDQDAGPVGELLQPLVDEDYQPPVATAAGGWSTSATTSLIINNNNNIIPTFQVVPSNDPVTPASVWATGWTTATTANVMPVDTNVWNTDFTGTMTINDPTIVSVNQSNNANWYMYLNDGSSVKEENPRIRLLEELLEDDTDYFKENTRIKYLVTQLHDEEENPEILWHYCPRCGAIMFDTAHHNYHPNPCDECTENEEFEQLSKYWVGIALSSTEEEDKFLVSRNGWSDDWRREFLPAA
jgi:hypothetical protein